MPKMPLNGLPAYRLPCTLGRFAHTDARVSIDATGRRATLQQYGKPLHALLLAPPQAAPPLW